METKRKALGKGLEQLFSNEVINFENFEKNTVAEAEKKSSVGEIKVSEVRSNPYQPRKTFNEETLNELAASIKEHGVIEPIIVKKAIKGYELVAGERRLKAAKIADLETIPAVVRDFNDQEMMEIALLENIQREDLNPIDEATAYQKIIELGGFTQEEFAEKFGKSRSHVTNMLGLLSLPALVKIYVQEGHLSMGHARALSKLTDEEKINELANKVIKENLSVRALEQLLNEEQLPKKQEQEKQKETKNVRNAIYERMMREKVGTKVRINTKKIEIPYDSPKDLERILEILGIRIEGL